MAADDVRPAKSVWVERDLKGDEMSPAKNSRLEERPVPLHKMRLCSLSARVSHQEARAKKTRIQSPFLSCMLGQVRWKWEASTENKN
jgi:hypothetical protein